MNLPAFLKSKICWIVTAAIVLIIIIGLAVGLTSSSSSSSANNESSTPTAEGSLLVKTTSEIQVLELKNDKFSVIVTEPIYGIVSFDTYPGRTVYYTTTIPGAGIFSSAKEKYPDITQYTEDWTKTALAVDYVNDKLYVLDSVDKSVYVIDTAGKYYKTIKNDFDSPIDLVLDPYERLLFVLQSSSILKVSVDGLSVDEIVKKPNLKALTIDRSSKTLYYSTSESVESFNYGSNIHTTVMPRKVDIPSLAVSDNYLFLVEVTKETSKPLPLNTILTSCHLTNGICSELKGKYKDDTMQSIKKFEMELHSKENLCMKDNGGCEHLCILLPEKKITCFCNEGWKLNNDNHTCKKNA